MVGSTIGAYRIVRELGRGGMGAVYLGEHTLIGRQAAIKVLLPEMSVNRANVERFFNEARATTAVTDPGIVQVFDFGFTPDNTAYIVMELLDGEQLNARLQRLGRLAPLDAVYIVRQVAGSLAAAHAAGIIHRDLKPENLFLIRDPTAPGGERVKILDFGIAKLDDAAAPDRSKTRTGAILGTPTYMSPEQCKSSGDVDHRTDIYSLGCVLFHLLTGRPPYDLQTTAEIIVGHLSGMAPAPSTFVPGLAPDLDMLAARCMAKAPRDRYASMRELADACDALLGRPSVLAFMGAPGIAAPGIVAPGTVPPRMTVPTAPPTPARSRRLAAIWVAVVGLAATGGVAVAIATAGGSPPAASPATASDPPAPSRGLAPMPASEPVHVMPVSPASVPADAAPAAAPEGSAAAPTATVPHSDSGATKHGSGTHPHAGSAKSAKGKAGAGNGSGDLYDDR